MGHITFDNKRLEITDGPFEATWDSLKQYKCPEWFANSKFGIWAHWGPQAVPCAGDWYARNMYIERSAQYNYHVKNYGHPSQFGYKDIIKLWKAENFEPDTLMKLYKKAGAKYFTALAVHHDNFDCWDSKYHNWNSIKFGPHKDIVGLWRDAALKEGLIFGITEHHERSYSWFNTNKGHDKNGQFAGIPYDGNDPLYEDLYYELHDDDNYAYPVAPSAKFVESWYLRIKDVVEKYNPDIIYMDGGVPFGEVGRAMIANYYNHNIKYHNGNLEAVQLLKDVNHIFTDVHHGEFVDGIGILDVELGVTEGIYKEPWQTDTYISDWFYNKFAGYKTAEQIIHLLIDTVSKNGNLLLNLALMPDGTLDDKSMKILNEITEWMAVNSEGIYDTRPWKVYGEGSTSAVIGAYKEQKTNYTSADFRFTRKGNDVYAFCMKFPENKKLLIKSFAADGKNDKVLSVKLLGYGGELEWRQDTDGLSIALPDEKPCGIAWVFKILK